MIVTVVYSLFTGGENDCASAFNKTVSELLESVGSSLIDPLLQLKPWRREEVARGHRNIKFLRSFGTTRVVWN